jgi:uncharacterized repeat protein (TIGR01451 family)
MNTTIGFDNQRGMFGVKQRALHSMLVGVGLAVSFVLFLLSGCQTLTLPRIDPTGNRIFAPGGTTLVNPLTPASGYPSTAPAFQEPPTPPKCIDGEKCKGCLGCLSKKNHNSADFERGRCGELLLTPNRLVAPVGGEVILLAGVCGKDGMLVTDEQIEWMLSPESVGQIVEVGDDAKGQKPSFWKKSETIKVEKLGVDFARGRTSREAGRITKGTSDPSDDLPLRKGQTWVSLTSPAEGTSKVTVLAPSSDVWDKRRQTATIYWVDASWDFPQPITVVDGSPANLVTKVMKSDGFVPAEGWKVRYRSLNPELAKLTVGVPPNASLSELADVSVDPDGKAGITLVRGQLIGAASTTTTSNGTALVEVEIIRPAIGDMPEVPLARTTTSVTWSAPNLVLDVFGPEVATPGQNLQYVIRVTNTGDLAAENVEVIAAFPPGVRVDYSYRPIQETNGSAVWGQFGPLAPRSAFEVVANVTPTTEMQGRIQVDVRSSSNQQVPTRTVPIIVQAPKLSLQFKPRQNITDIPIDGQVILDGLLVNNGTQTINDVRVQIDAESGLVDERYGQSSVATNYPAIRPGEPIPFEISFRVTREGLLRVTASAIAQGQTLGSQVATLRGITNASQPAPGAASGTPQFQLDVFSSPDSNQLAIGKTVTVSCVVTNTSSTVLPRPELVIAHDGSFRVQNLDPETEYDPNRRTVIWRIKDMQPKQKLEFKASFTAISENREAIIEMEASSNGAYVPKRFTYSIISNSPAPPVSNGGLPGLNPGGPVLPGGPTLPGGTLPAAPVTPGDTAPGSGLPPLPGNLPLPGTSSAKPPLPVSHSSNISLDQRLGLSIQPLGETFRRGDTATYEVTLTNLSQEPDQKVSLQLNLPAGSKIVSVKALSLNYRTSEDGRIVEFTPIQFLRVRDSFSYLIQLKHEKPGKAEISAAAKSIGQPVPVFSKQAVLIQ